MDLLYETGVRWGIGTCITLVLIANYYEGRKLLTAWTLPFKFLLGPTIGAVLLPLLFVGLPFAAVFRQIVRIVSYVKYGSKFGGLLDGPDIPVAIENTTPVQALFIVQYKNEDSKPFYEVAKETIRKAVLSKFREEPKSFGILQRSLGYLFILKEERTFDDCFRKLKTINSVTEEISKSDLLRIMNEDFNTSLFSDSKALWEVIVGAQPVKWKNQTQDDSIQFYPIILRANHTLGDALNMFKGIIELFSDEEIKECDKTVNFKKLLEHSLNQINNNNHENIKDSSWLQKFIKTAGSNLKWYMQGCYTALVCPALYYCGVILAMIDVNILQGSPLTNEIIQCVNVEESPHYVRVVKRIKRKFPGSTFEDVFLTAFTASLSEYFKKHSAPIPEYLIAPTAVVPEAVELLHFILDDEEGRSISCRNVALITTRKLPISVAYKDTDSSFVNTLEFVKKERRFLRNSIESKAISLIRSTLMMYYPTTIVEMFLKVANKYAATISNIPGPPCIMVLGGCPVRDIVTFASHGNERGIAFMIISYDDRIQLGLSVDKMLISEESEVQGILDGIYKYIDLLDKAAPR